MEYIEAKTGRVFIARFDGGDDILEGLTRIAVRSKIRTACFHALGALRDQRLVVGSRFRGGRNFPDRSFAGGEWEILGFGTIFPENGKPKIHLHVSTGRKSKTLTGCLRGKAAVYITVECVITEILPFRRAEKKTNAAGLSPINFVRGKK